jgi:hypothetical protein
VPSPPSRTRLGWRSSNTRHPNIIQTRTAIDFAGNFHIRKSDDDELAHHPGKPNPPKNRDTIKSIRARRRPIAPIPVTPLWRGRTPLQANEINQRIFN